jgi:hypothetical protein
MSSALVSWNSSGAYYPDCGGFHTLERNDSVSLSFVGKQTRSRALSKWVIVAHCAPGDTLAIDFFGDIFSAIAYVAIDNYLVVPVDTSTSSSSISDDCAASARPWSSGYLGPGNHTVTVQGYASLIAQVVYTTITIRDFVYVHISQILELVLTNSTLSCN